MAKIDMKLDIKFDPRRNEAFKKMGESMIKVNSGIQAFARKIDKIIGLFKQPKKMNGQGIVFYFISRWFFPARERSDFWGNPGNPQAAYYQAWFRGRTVKSMKPPIRFKGWKQGR